MASKYTLISSRPERKQMAENALSRDALMDGHGRSVDYLRLSITDRCDLRCSYCMPEKMTFLPKSDVLSYEELLKLTDVFISRGVSKIRITGGEPLVRKDVLNLIERLAEKRKTTSLENIVLTTNGTLLGKYASKLVECGVERVNVSLDTLNPEKFAKLTRRDVFGQVMDGLKTAREAGIKIKINTVALKGHNEHELFDLISWAHDNDFDISLIELMPLGEGMENRSSDYLSLKDVKTSLEERWNLQPLTDNMGGPSKYMRVAQTGGRLGFISPLSDMFCSSCNRVRLTCTGTLHTCLGHEKGFDLRPALRSENWAKNVNSLLDEALAVKPLSHGFTEENIDTPATSRTMSVTGG